jgi:hypothetical protein
MSNGNGSIEYALGELKGLAVSTQNQITSMKGDFERAIEVIHERIDDLTSRTTTLETARHQMTGGIVAAKVLVPLIWAFIVCLVVGVFGFFLWLTGPSLENLRMLLTK